MNAISSKFKLALIQMRCSQSLEENMQRAVSRIEAAAQQGAKMICLQELFRSQYFCQTEDPAFFDLSESIPGPSTEILSQVARRHEVVVIGSLFERRDAGVYHNTAVVLDADGALLGTYRKMHIPDDPLYYEKYYFTPGDQGYKTFDTRYGRIGTLVCWDQWYPEGARITALQGAKVLFYPTAIGWHPSERDRFGMLQRDAWKTIQRAHAIANGVYVVAVNRVGHEGPADGGIEFWGSSFVSDPFGAILAEASETLEDTLFAEYDPLHLEDIRRHWPFLRDRRIDSYGNIVRRLIDGNESP
jgi:N-carbamoylputrescine amidase